MKLISHISWDYQRLMARYGSKKNKFKKQKQQIYANLSVIVQVPQIEFSHTIDSGEEGGIDGRPFNVIHVITIVLERVQHFRWLKQKYYIRL